MKYAIIVLTAWCAFGSTQLFAGTPTTIDARQILMPIVVADKDNTTQNASFEKTVMLQNDVAEQLLGTAPAELTITNFSIPSHGEATLTLKRTPDVFDANSEFYVNTPSGKRRFSVHPIVSYKGKVDGDPNSLVSLHYSKGDLTGFIFHNDGSRTAIGRSEELRPSASATPHFISDATAGQFSESLSQFVCGTESLPTDEGAIVRSMLMPSSVSGKGESVQAWPLKEMRLAIVLREDIDSILKLRGYTDEQVAQHFAKIIACISQAYEEDLRARLYIGYLLVHTTDAPSGYWFNGAYPGQLLDEFSQDWSSSQSSVPRAIAHLYTKKVPRNGQYVGGIAYSNGSLLCVKSHRGGYGVSTIDLNPGTVMPGKPTERNAFVWDVYVAAHEMGHNIGSPHTHNCYWSPPVDTCVLKSDSTDACYDSPSLRRVRPGTIMSYCHLVNNSSTPLTFGSRVSERMRTWIDQAQCVVAPANPIVSITSPRGTDDWDGGSKLTIKWVSSKVSNINLDYSIGDTSSWKTIIHNKPAVDSQYIWTVPNESTPRMWLRISDASNANVYNISIASYTVTVPLSVTAPVGGERLGQNSPFAIKWVNSAGGAVNIQFAADGTTFTEIATNITAAVYDWITPNIETSTARIRIVLASNTAITATSQPFAIGIARFRLLLPRDGMTVCNDVETQYNWDGDFIDRIRIQYSVDNGGSWKNALQPATVQVKQWQIFSRNSSLGTVDNGTKALLRVVNSATDTVLDTRSDITIDSCGIVTGYTDEQGAPSKLAIESVSPNPASTSIDVKLTHSAGAQVEFLLVDVTGQTISLMNTSLANSGTTSVYVPLNNQSLSTGSYQLVVKSGSTSVSAPLTIVR